MNAIVAEVVSVALDDVDGVKEFVKRNRDDRQEFLNRANGRMLKPIDPHTNFVMIDAQHSAEEVIEHFRKHNVLIGRRFPPLNNYVRVSLGTPDEMSTFWEHLGYVAVVEQAYASLAPVASQTNEINVSPSQLI